MNRRGDSLGCTDWRTGSSARRVLFAEIRCFEEWAYAT